MSADNDLNIPFSWTERHARHASTRPEKPCRRISSGILKRFRKNEPKKRSNVTAKAFWEHVNLTLAAKSASAS
jgi:hypothetical protein